MSQDHNVGGTEKQAESGPRKAGPQPKPSLKAMGNPPKHTPELGAERGNPSRIRPDIPQSNAGRNIVPISPVPDPEITITVNIPLPLSDYNRLKWMENEWDITTEEQISVMVRGHLEMDRTDELQGKEAA